MRLSGFPRRWVTVESLVLGCLLPFAVLPTKSALSVVILLLPHHCLFQVHHHSVILLQHYGMQIGARQSLEQSAARKLFYRQGVHLMVNRYFGHVDLTRFLEVAILVGGLDVIAALVGLSDSADAEATKM